jgi:hypothetical protein
VKLEGQKSGELNVNKETRGMYVGYGGDKDLTVDMHLSEVTGILEYHLVALACHGVILQERGSCAGGTPRNRLPLTDERCLRWFSR